MLIQCPSSSVQVYEKKKKEFDLEYLFFFYLLFRLIGAYDSLVLIISTQVFLYEYIFFVHSAPIGDKTRKPKLLKPQPRKLVLVSRRLQQYNYHSACSAIVYFDALLFFSWKLGVANRGVHCTSRRCFAN